MDDVIAVVAIDKHTGFIKTVTSCDKEDSQRYAKYYRSIGYNAKVVDYDTLDEMIEKEREERMMYALA